MTIVERFLQLRTELDAAYESYWVAEDYYHQRLAYEKITLMNKEIEELKRQKLQGKIEYREPGDYTRVFHSANLGRPIPLEDNCLLPREVYGNNQNAAVGSVPLQAIREYAPRSPIAQEQIFSKSWFSSLYIRLKNFLRGFHGGNTGAGNS